MSGTLWGILAIVAAVVIGTLITIAVIRRRRRGQLVSIVLLRTTVRNLTGAEVRGAVRRALGNEMEVKEIPPVDEQMRGYVVLLRGEPGLFVIDARRPYADDVEAESAMFEDPRAREAYAAHKAWVSVDLVGGPPPEDMRQGMTQAMARLAAEFYDDQTTLLYAPAICRVALPGPDLEATLKGDDPLSIFGDDEVNTPIINVEKGDQRIERAMSEARRQWPVFVEVYRRRGDECHPMVKGGFLDGDGDREYMWLEVSAVDAAQVTGVLANEPARVKDVRKGDTVKLNIDEVADWACLDEGDQPKGLFVERLLRG